MWGNARFLYLCHVGNLNFLYMPNVKKFQISPHMLCEEIWTFSTWQIFLHINIDNNPFDIIDGNHLRPGGSSVSCALLLASWTILSYHCSSSSLSCHHHHHHRNHHHHHHQQHNHADDDPHKITLADVVIGETTSCGWSGDRGKPDCDDDHDVDHDGDDDGDGGNDDGHDDHDGEECHWWQWSWSWSGWSWWEPGTPSDQNLCPSDLNKYYMYTQQIL